MNSKDLEEKYLRYTLNLQNAFLSLHVLNSSKKINEVLDLAKRYLDDAKHFKEKNQIITALISLAYSEGLLDALRILNYVKFEWVGLDEK